MRVLWTAILLFAQGTPAPEPKLEWVDFKPPQYPQMAKVAHIIGTVEMEFYLYPDGSICHIKALKGHQILIEAARESLESSTYRCVDCGGIPQKFKVTFHFRIP